MKPDSYVAIINRAQQIGASEWDTWQECLVCHELVTVKDLHEWVKKRTSFGGNHAASITLYFAEVKND